jgi:hypothetical protein
LAIYVLFLSHCRFYLTLTEVASVTSELGCLWKINFPADMQKSRVPE